MRYPKTVFCAVVALVVFTGLARADVPFVRGDTNADGVIDVIDSENICSYLFASALKPPCLDACDVNDDGSVNIADAISVLGSAFKDKTIPAPLSPGDDPTPDAVPCANWDGYAPLVESGTVLTVASCAIPGGSESYVETQVMVTTDKTINSAQFTLELEGVSGTLFDVTAVKGGSTFAEVSLDGHKVGFIHDVLMQSTVGTGPDIAILNLVICVPAGTPAGTYSLRVADGRAGVVGDLNAHLVETQDAAVTVEAAVTEGECIAPTPPEEDPPPPELVKGIYRIEGPSSITPDQKTVTLTLQAAYAKPVVALDVAIDFSEAVLMLRNVEKTLAVGGTPAKVFDVTVGPATCETMVNDSLEGYVAMHIELADPQAWQADQPYEVAKLTFELRSPPADLYGRTRLALRDVGPDDALVNKVRFLDNGTEKESAVDGTKNLFTFDLPGPMPPMAATTDDVQSTFVLTEGAGSPGDTAIPIYFFIETNTAIQGFCAAFMYDKSILAIESMTSLAHLCGEKPDFLAARVVTPDDPDAPHGAVIAVVGDMMNEYFYYPGPNEPVACARFSILPDARPGDEAEITFVDGVLMSPPADNVVVYQGMSVTPGTEPTDVHVNTLKSGRVLVLGEVTPFLRGDANVDFRLNIADAVTVLSFLFVRGQALPCPDAADANDDGKLDIADPIALLHALFTPQKTISAPYPGMGKDPTPDALGGCRY